VKFMDWEYISWGKGIFKGEKRGRGGNFNKKKFISTKADNGKDPQKYDGKGFQEDTVQVL